MIELTDIEKENKILKEKCESQQMMLDMTSAYMTQIREELEDSKAKLSEAYKHMKDGIKYAERIQKSLLMSYEHVNEIFPNAFIYYKAKDILSGDFYWFYQDGPIKYVAAIDCTGHGVPGAMLTVLVNSLLVQIVKERKLRNPQGILAELDRLVDYHLSDETHQVEVKDGLDIAFCVFDTDQDILYFSGAHLPVYIIRNGELVEYKGARYSLGDNSERKKVLNTQEIHLKQGDCIYLFSDGYVDQFGGAKNQKFMKKNFRKLLLKHHDLPMAQQKKQLIENITSWKGGLKQTDDILIIGINY
ncbi:MAG: PP2C family protein-serine/threonine phosphatase [Flammeovirgaceae bacterium]